MLLTAGTFTAVMQPLVPVPLFYILTDSIITGALLALLCLIMNKAIAFSIFSIDETVQRYVNYAALGFIFILTWIGLGMFLLYLSFPSEIVHYFVPTLPIRALIALLVFSFIVSIQNKISNLEDKDTMELEDSSKKATESIEYKEEILEHIAVKKGSQIDLIPVNEIICMQAEGDYVQIYSTEGLFLKEQTMKYFSEHLPQNKFVRVHRSSIVNIDYIVRIEAYEKQQQLIILHNDLKIKSSINGYRELKRKLNL